MRKLFVMGLAVAACMTFAASKAMAADIPIIPLKLIIVDKVASTGIAKVVFVAKDTNVSKGTATNVAAISSQIDISYDAEEGSFVNPSGGNWLVNKDTVAKYVNKNAPSGGGTKVSVIKPGKLLKNVGKNLGDNPIDISSAPTGDVEVVYTVDNGDTFRHCGEFDGPTCSHKSIAAGTGWKLSCKGNGSLGTCPTPSTTVTTTVTSTTVTTSTTLGSPSSAFVD